LVPDQPAGAVSPNIESHGGAGCKRPAARARFSIGQKVVVVTIANSVSRKSFDYAKRLSELLRSDDMIAVSHFIAIMEPTGECRYLPKGTVATVEHSNWYGNHCIRPEGDIGLWADRTNARRCCNSWKIKNGPRSVSSERTV
jgi:hypothetical protein